MAYDTFLEKRLELHLAELEDISVKKMFGGICFMFQNKMAVGIVGDKLMVRIVQEKMEKELAEEHVSPMDFTGKPMKEFVYVDQVGILQERELLHYIKLGLEHAERASRK